MPNIDIPVTDELKKLFDVPPCDMLRLPLPKPIKIQLPTGGSLKAFADISKGIPTDCAMTFSLLLQLAPLLASMECLVKILKFLKAILDVVPGPPTPSSIQKFAKAAADLAPCFLIPTPASLIPFVKDILCLILKTLNCVIGQLKSIIAVLGPITIQLDAAATAGNTELEDNLNCAKENAEITGQHLTQAIEPIGVILDMLSPLMEIAGVQPIQLPALGSKSDVESLKNILATLQGLQGTILVVTEALGGCDS